MLLEEQLKLFEIADPMRGRSIHPLAVTHSTHLGACCRCLSNGGRHEIEVTSGEADWVTVFCVRLCSECFLQRRKKGRIALAALVMGLLMLWAAFQPIAEGRTLGALVLAVLTVAVASFGAYRYLFGKDLAKWDDVDNGPRFRNKEYQALYDLDFPPSTG